MKNKTPKYIYAANTIREDIKNGTIVERLPGEGFPVNVSLQRISAFHT
jgi:hypothetical protein